MVDLDFFALVYRKGSVVQGWEPLGVPVSKATFWYGLAANTFTHLTIKHLIATAIKEKKNSQHQTFFWMFNSKGINS